MTHKSILGYWYLFIVRASWCCICVNYGQKAQTTSSFGGATGVISGSLNGRKNQVHSVPLRAISRIGADTQWNKSSQSANHNSGRYEIVNSQPLFGRLMHFLMLKGANALEWPKWHLNILSTVNEAAYNTFV
jgi:hypothetical protein